MKPSNHNSFSLARRSTITAAFAVLLGTSVAIAQSSTGSGSSSSSTGGSGSTSSQKSGSSGSTYGTGTTPGSSSSGTYDSTSRGTSGSSSTTGTTGTSGTSATTGSSSSTDTTGGATTATGRDMGSGKLGFMDRRFVTKAAEASATELSLAQLAAQQATNPEVKSFAQSLIEDHTKVNSALTSMASQRQVDLDKEDPKQDRTYRKLAKKSGSEFDQEFVEHMIEMHESDVKRFEKASQDAKDTAVRSFASQHVNDLRQHLQKAQSLRQTIMPTGREEGTSGSSRSSSDSSTSPSSSSSSTSPSSSSSSSTPSSTSPSSSSDTSSSSSSSSDTTKKSR